MFNRLIIKELEKWAKRKDRKPLILRGVRQVGKTTIISQFAEQYENYIYLNLELAEEKRIFEEFTDIETLVQRVFFVKNISLSKKSSTLLFIDEIQEIPSAFNTLRYFYEKFPQIHIIAAGSLLESLFLKENSFPVGRVDYLVLRPVSFPEFLNAIGENTALEQLQKIPAADFVHEKLLRLFHTYAVIGGMPEAVRNYCENKDFVELQRIYEALIAAYLDDVEKYASTSSQTQTFRLVIKSCFFEAGKRIKFEGFGKSNYRSREIGEALRTIEKAMLIQLIYPLTSSVLPLLADHKKSPRLHVVDSGMLSHFVGIQKELISSGNLHEVYQGTLIEHLIGQEILATQFNVLSALHFWVREKSSSSAEVDYIFPYEGKLIPIEVKSGTQGKLKSLHLYMETAPHQMAVRFFAGKQSIQKVEIGERKYYYLLNLPYYLASQLEQYLKWFEKEIAIEK